jgi:hypothetical protein
VKAPRWRWVVLGFVALLGLTESAIRQAGAISFPVYVRSAEFGYAPRGNQQGTFLGTNRWVFNDRGMGVDRSWNPGKLTDILLIGNSIVMGGNPYDQKDKLTPQLQTRLGNGCPIWPVAAGGWSTVNEMRFLQANPDLMAGTDFFIWVQMPGQMQGLNPWVSENLHPTQAPFWATWYVVRKALAARFPGTGPPALISPADTSAHHQQFDELLGRLVLSSKRRLAGMIFMYPDRAQLLEARAGKEWLEDRQLLQSTAEAHGIMLIDVTRFPQWNESLYKDPVHPTAEGNAVLAAILTSALQTAGALPECTNHPR